MQAMEKCVKVRIAKLTSMVGVDEIVNMLTIGSQPPSVVGDTNRF